MATILLLSSMLQQQQSHRYDLPSTCSYRVTAANILCRLCGKVCKFSLTASLLTNMTGNASHTHVTHGLHTMCSYNVVWQYLSKIQNTMRMYFNYKNRIQFYNYCIWSTKYKTHLCVNTYFRYMYLKYCTALTYRMFQSKNVKY